LTDWFRSWHGAPTDPKWIWIGRRAKCLPPIAFAVGWAVFDHASQASPRGDVSGFDADVYAAWAGLEEEAVRGVLAAMQDKGMIVEGRLANWAKRQPERDDGASERAREWRAEKKARAQPAAAAATTPELDFSAPPEPANASERKRTQANAPESDPETDPETDSSSSVVVPFEPRAAARDDDDEILIAKIGKALGPRVEARVTRRGLPVVRGWLAEGLDLDLDVLPELAEVSRKLKQPLRTLAPEQNPFIREQMLARRDGRLAAQKARGGAPEPPDRVFVAVDTPEWARRVAAGHSRTLHSATAVIDGRRVNGWYFPAGPPDSPTAIRHSPIAGAAP
jgi:hypothetical protein